MDLRLEAALEGNLDVFQQGLREAWLKAGRQAMEDMADMGLGVLRGSVVEAGLGERLANTWRAEIYPSRGYADDPALLLYSKAPEIIQSHEGETIFASGGKWMAIPIPGSPAENFRSRSGTKIEYARQKYGDRLFVIPARAGRPAILAAEGVSITKTGRLSARKKLKSGKYGKGVATIFLFWLVPQVTLEARLDVQADFARIEREFVTKFPQVLGEHLLRAGLT